jgi:hypothetical protein
MSLCVDTWLGQDAGILYTVQRQLGQDAGILRSPCNVPL